MVINFILAMNGMEKEAGLRDTGQRGWEGCLHCHRHLNTRLIIWEPEFILLLTAEL
jgi:hypothetical protein